MLIKTNEGLKRSLVGHESCVMRPASQRFIIHSCIYLRILIITYVATFLALIAFLCWCAVKQSINQSWLKSLFLVASRGLCRTKVQCLCSVRWPSISRRSTCQMIVSSWLFWIWNESNCFVWVSIVVSVSSLNAFSRPLTIKTMQILLHANVVISQCSILAKALFMAGSMFFNCLRGHSHEKMHTHFLVRFHRNNK